MTRVCRYLEQYITDEIVRAHSLKMEKDYTGHEGHYDFFFERMLIDLSFLQFM